MGARLLVIQHEDDCPPAWFGEWLGDAGLTLDVRRGHLGEPVPETLDADHDGLVVLGGEMGAYDDAAHPWLTATKRLIAATVVADRPFLGICLGHQLAAVALGGEVIVNPAGRAVGLVPVAPTAEGAADPLLGGIRPGAPSIQWNRDVVARLPDGSTVLALAPDGTVQAARFGPSAWGVQFHPEASPAIFEWWVSLAAPGDARDQATAAVTRIAAGESGLRRDWEPLARRFADLVAERVKVT